ncbi:DUF6318 family protein [Actinopolymorpha pittospori]|uniref:DUF6318 domain-containing protein n=1 Tax=Actinopolymorpha pittospori TaxID=648752 RepID=A0A927MYD0_9ACTN|nr:DUF6318 family protein [Actinopolymorpha pittospori]MBE1608786.1 hypothetical protein [Actinopolymorpha pittospori]
MTHTPHLGRVALALAAAGVLTLAGCANTPEPPDVVADTTPPSTSAPATPSATPSPTPTVTPTEDLEAQLLAATQTFYATLNNAYKTLDTQPLRDSTPALCEACQRYIESIESTKADGNHYTGVGEYVVRNFKLVTDGVQEESKASATYDLTYTGFKEIDKTNKIVRNIGSQTWGTQALLQRDGDKWLFVEELDLE